jgi:hypothetical protein
LFLNRYFNFSAYISDCEKPYQNYLTARYDMIKSLLTAPGVCEMHVRMVMRDYLEGIWSIAN